MVIWSNGALVPVTEYVYCLGPGGAGGGGGGGGASVDDGVADACGVVVTMISSCIGGVDVGAVLGVASLVVSVRATSRDTETTRAIAATIGALPTNRGQGGVLASAA